MSWRAISSGILFSESNYPYIFQNMNENLVGTPQFFVFFGVIWKNGIFAFW